MENTSNDDRVIQDVYRKIGREKDIIRGATALRQSTSNAVVQQRCDTNIRESEKNIAYLEQTMQQLQLRKRNSGANQSGPEQTNHQHNPSDTSTASDHSSGVFSTGGQQKRNSTSQYSDGSFPAAQSETTLTGENRDKIPSKPRPNFTRLDLIKYDTPYLGPRIQLMLQQLEFKLSVEKQYKEGIEKMLRLYQMEGDRRSKAEAESKKIESTQKIQLLKKSLKRYSDMHIDFEEDMGDNESLTTSNLRRPITGNLKIICYAIKDVDHVATARLSKATETMITVKVEDQTRAKTKWTRTERWNEEFELSVDKANEIEIVVYDKIADQGSPVGLLWLRISDIVEALRRKKVEQELNSAGWVSASKVQSTGSGNGLGNNGSGILNPDYYHSHHNDNNHASAPQSSELSGLASSTSIIDAWFVLEPAGQIHLGLGFEKANRQVKKPYDLIGGLGRQGAIRQKKEEVHEMHGHKFVQQQFYNIMRCALCGDFLKYSGGYQCLDCRYTCHKKCYPKVVTKCISKASTDTDPDEEKLNHRIPHRFEPVTNMSANWCCHCGYILPLGKKNVRKCTECGLTCHAHCVHFVPDFCGMSMEMANQILSEIKSTKIRQASSAAAGSSPLSLMSSQNYSFSSGPPSSTGTTNRHPPTYQGATTQTTPRPPRKEPVRRKEVGSGASTSPVIGMRPGNTAFPFQTSGIIPESLHTSGPPNDSAAAAVAAVGRAGVTSHGISQPAGQQLQPTGIRPSIGAQGGQGPPHTANHNQPELRSSPVSTYPARGQVAGIATKRDEVPQKQNPVFNDAVRAASAAHTAAYPSSQDAQGQQHLTQQHVQSTVPVSAQHQSPRRTGNRKKVGLDDFNFLAVLGKGNFGKVMLAESRHTKQLYAIKVLKKDFIIDNEEVESTRSEKRVFLVANRERHPFLLNLHSCFQTENRIYFVMQYISGGDLMWHIQKEQFTARRAQFYAAEVLLALKYFHENGVIYRDLKLDNILLTLSGHIKIADYGLCKEDMWYGKTTLTFCGTPEFMAPEILKEQGYGRAVDWWAFGVLLYQMLLGQSPFRGEDDEEIFDAILADEPLYPIHMPRDSVSILQQLLTQEPEERLGAGPKDALDIMAHPYFRNINFDDIYNCRVPPPYVPKIDSATDVQNFDEEFTKEVPALTPVNATLTPAMQEQFRGFSYINGEGV